MRASKVSDAETHRIVPFYNLLTLWEEMSNCFVVMGEAI